MELKTPTPLQSEHQALSAEINQAVRLEGSTGKATRLVARLIERHFAKEEEFALPPLGLLPLLAQGTIETGMAAAITMAAKLHDELPNLLAEQRVIIAALEELMAVAESEGHAELVGFAEKLMLHEEIEEKVYYPTAILIGKYLQLRLKN
jgi:hemerythrin HHE cation binding domain-containing protein